MLKTTPSTLINNSHSAKENADQDEKSFLENVHKKQKKKTHQPLGSEAVSYFTFLENCFLHKEKKDSTAINEAKKTVNVYPGKESELIGQGKRLTVNLSPRTNLPVEQKTLITAEYHNPFTQTDPLLTYPNRLINQKSVNAHVIPAKYKEIDQDENSHTHKIREVLTSFNHTEKQPYLDNKTKVTTVTQKVKEILQNMQRQHLLHENFISLTDRTSSSLNIHYQFQNWPGDHFVNVAMEKYSQNSSQLNLQASDIRTATLLASHKGLLPEYELVFFKQGNEHQQKQHKHQQSTQDEELE